MPARFRIIFVLLFALGLLARGQTAHLYQLDLLGDGRIMGELRIAIPRDDTPGRDSLYLHLPSRSISVAGSFFQQQYAEFQKVDLHFAKEEEKGHLEIQRLYLGNDSLNIPAGGGEFLRLPANSGYDSRPGHSHDTLRITFLMTLPAENWTGSYREGEDFFLIDWLPRLAPYDSTGWRLHPVTYHRDMWPQPQEMEVHWRVPEDYLIASNLPLHCKSEKEHLKRLAARPFRKTEFTGYYKEVIFRGHSGNLQFILSPHFYVQRMAHGGYLFSRKADPRIIHWVDSLHPRISRFMQREFDQSLVNDYHLVMLPDKVHDYQSDRMLSLSHPGNSFELARQLALARLEAHFRYRLAPDGFREVWLARGIPYYYKYRFIEEVYPEEYWTPFQEFGQDRIWQPLAHFLTGYLLSLNQFDYGYHNEYLYHFLARQGLDQPMATRADSLTRLNYTAVTQAKSYLALRHLRAFAGENSFKRALRDFSQLPSGTASADSLRHYLNYYHNEPVDWFFEDWLPNAQQHDYALLRTEHCPTVTTAKVRNTGRLSLPYSLTGYRDKEPVITEWFAGHEKRKTQQIHHAKYDKVVLNHHFRSGELNGKNNSVFMRKLLPRLKPVQFQFYQSFENPRTQQIFFFPGTSYNAYDQFLIGLDMFNYGFTPRKWQWVLGPEYSTGQNKLTGTASLLRNFLPAPESRFHRIAAGAFARYRHYDFGLSFFRFSPVLRLDFRKPYPRSSILQYLRLRGVHLERELPPQFEDVANDISNASYTVVQLQHRYEETNILRPYTLQTEITAGRQFSRLSAEADFRWMLPSRAWLIWRSFAGVFLHNDFARRGINNNFYSLGLSGTQDFMFDYPFIGRSDSTGIWNQQFFVTDGGFKSATGLFADRWMLTTGLNLPLWRFIGVFGDVGLADNFDEIYYDYGIRLALVADFLEVYFPLANHQREFWPAHNYPQHIRYVLNLDLDRIIERVRRGYY